jgi:hypothetical protein
MNKGTYATGGDEEREGRCFELPGGMVSLSWFASQLGVDLVRELPQIGDSLAQIGKLSVDRADFSDRCEAKHHTELLERRFHGYSFDKIPLVTEPAIEGIIPPSFLLYSR